MKKVSSVFTETIIETYDNPDFKPIVRKVVKTKIINDRGEEINHTSNSVYSLPEFTKAEYRKALVLALARYGRLLELPYTIGGIDDHNDSAQWYYSLTNDNSPGKTTFSLGREAYPAFRELVIGLDFRFYDDKKAQEIREMYKKDRAKANVDADLIIQGELGELEGK